MLDDVIREVIFKWEHEKEEAKQWSRWGKNVLGTDKEAKLQSGHMTS